jgi:hypothetical protein
MKTLYRSALIVLLAIGAASCGGSSILAPDCEDPTTCPYQPGSNSYQPGSNSYQPGSNSYQPGSNSLGGGVG